MDGARLANALAALGCSPADLTWRAGVDVLSLGAIKNGALGAEAIVAFDDAAAEELVYRTKRSGHVTSKMRFQSAQLAAYLTDGLWLRLASHANQRMAELAAELAPLAGDGVRLVERVDVNMAFVELPAAAADRLPDAGIDLLPDDRHQRPAGHELADQRPTTWRRQAPRSGKWSAPGDRPASTWTSSGLGSRPDREAPGVLGTDGADGALLLVMPRQHLLHDGEG